MKNRRCALIAAAVLVHGAATALPAQTVRGTVVDSASSQPLTSVFIELLRPDSQVIEQVTSDETGGFLLRAPEPGTYAVRAQRIGFRPFESVLVLDSRGETNLGVRLAAVPVELPPVTVEAARDGYLVTRGFYQRKESERGVFLDPAAVEKRVTKAKLATDVLIGIPGVEIRAGAPLLRACQTIGSMGSAHPSAPRIYIDGVDAGSEIMVFLQPSDILAVEVYMGPSQIPLQYGGTSTPCGVILIWTRH